MMKNGLILMEETSTFDMSTGINLTLTERKEKSKVLVKDPKIRFISFYIKRNLFL